jgi:hypothetical protein
MNALGDWCRTPGVPPAAQQQQVITVISAIVQQASTPAELQNRLADGLRTETVAVRQADADGDGTDDLLVGGVPCGLPLLLYRQTAPDQPVLLPSGASDPGNPLERIEISQVADVNGDGKPEVVAARLLPGGSGSTAVPSIWQWQADHFVTLFSAPVISWRGRNRWQVEDGAVTIQCRPMGPFQHKLSPHRQLTERFRWQSETAGYVLADRTWEPVTTQLHQIDVAERLFYAGQYAEARRAYEAVAQYPPHRDDAVAWAPFSRWRIAEIDALLGRRAEALAELDRGAAETYPLGKLAGVFRDAYAQSGAAAGFEAVAQYLGQEAVPERWPYLFDATNIAARPVLEDAFRRAGRPLPATLPEAPRLAPADCREAHS